MNIDQRFFGERRLREALARTAGFAPKEMVQGMLGTVKEFAGDAPLSDDITVLAVRWTP
jgi:sigma-B regulation protein RsbU (phosphoserine phosphatase)